MAHSAWRFEHNGGGKRGASSGKGVVLRTTRSRKTDQNDGRWIADRLAPALLRTFVSFSRSNC